MVFIPDADRGTLCVSSQVGCTLNCRFCHTGTMQLVRNLTSGEIVGRDSRQQIDLERQGDTGAAYVHRRGKREEVVRVGRLERDVDGIDAGGTKGRVVHRRRDRVAGWTRDDAVDRRVLRDSTKPELGAEPFVVAAMGSHGGATPAGQRELLAGYDLDEAPVITDPWLKLFPSGVALSTSAALCPPALPGEDAATPESCQEPPS